MHLYALASSLRVTIFVVLAIGTYYYSIGIWETTQCQFESNMGGGHYIGDSDHTDHESIIIKISAMVG